MALPVVSFGSIAPPAPSCLPGFPTVVLPVDPALAMPEPSPSIASTSTRPLKRTRKEANVEESLNLSTVPDLRHLARSVLNAKKVAVVCGAGISTASGIPDFRSSSGLFESLKHKYPDANISTGRDLFDVGLFASEHNASIFYNMIAELKQQTDQVEPTSFHRWLKALDDEKKLFRVYTQNIDALEERAGLSYGLGGTAPPSRAPSASPSKPKARSASPGLPTSSQASTSSTVSSLGLRRSSSTSSLSSLSSISSCSDNEDIAPVPTSRRNLTKDVPRCIPLHGQLQTLSCPLCHTTYPLNPFLPSLSLGQPPQCPHCQLVHEERTELGRRSRGVGYLKPDVVLYGEPHKDGDRIGHITGKDLMGARPDLLIVVGTTLKVPGTKKLVKELAKVIKPPPTTTTTTTRVKKMDKISTVFLNKEFPGGGKEWMGVFDCWARGDIQEFVTVLEQERKLVEQEKRDKLERKNRSIESSSSTTQVSKTKSGKLPSRPTKPKSSSFLLEIDSRPTPPVQLSVSNLPALPSTTLLEPLSHKRTRALSPPSIVPGLKLDDEEPRSRRPSTMVSTRQSLINRDRPKPGRSGAGGLFNSFTSTKPSLLQAANTKTGK
ncbi:uncharacterized protein JCM15063_000550 [Sporobolomyces koalae]|uniref:uncharacterized protein n=1 Tax=Sporobolomyces koalae TaxID=500713 RepID=UPI0031735792